MNLYLKQLKKSLVIPFIIAVLIIIIDVLFLDNLKYNRLWQIINILLLSYISSFIFYFIVIHIKEQKDKDNISEVVNRYVKQIIGDANTIKKELEKCSGKTIESNYPNKEELDKLCSNIKMSDQAPLIIGGSHPNYIYANWLQYLDYNRKHSLKAIEKTLILGSFLDSELVKIIVKIEGNSLFNVTKTTVNLTMGHIVNLDHPLKQNCLFDYFELIRQLEQYSNNKLKK